MAVEYLQASAPTSSSPVKVGDLWLDTSVHPAILKVCVATVPAIVWSTTGRTASPAAVIADSSTAAPAGGTGATAGAYDTAGNRDTAITVINDVRTKLNSVLAALRTAGILQS